MDDTLHTHSHTQDNLAKLISLQGMSLDPEEIPELWEENANLRGRVEVNLQPLEGRGKFYIIILSKY